MIRGAHEREFESVVRVLEGALLAVDLEDVRAAIRRGDVLIAVERGHFRGALVLDDARIEAIAVTRTHRGKGIGSALVERAAERVTERGPLAAEFRSDERPFYESLGFEIEQADEKRLRGRLSEPR